MVCVFAALVFTKHTSKTQCNLFSIPQCTDKRILPVERGTPEKIQCHLGREESSQSKRGLRTRPLLLSRLSAMRPPWSASVPLPWLP
jgi:hypothetical protein